MLPEDTEKPPVEILHLSSNLRVLRLDLLQVLDMTQIEKGSHLLLLLRVTQQRPVETETGVFFIDCWPSSHGLLGGGSRQHIRYA